MVHLINDPLLYEYFDRWSVDRATKGINVLKQKTLSSGKLQKI